MTNKNNKQREHRYDMVDLNHILYRKYCGNSTTLKAKAPEGSSEMIDTELRMKIARLKGWRFDPSGVWLGPSDPDGSRLAGYFCPNWTNNIADAWELYREMKQAGCIVVVTHELDGRGYCHVNTLQQGDKLIGVYSFDEPHAICEAWLAWKEAKR